MRCFGRARLAFFFIAAALFIPAHGADAILLSTGSSSVGSGQKVWVGQGAHTSDSSGFQFFDRNALMASAGTVDKLAIHRNNLEASGGESTATLYLNGAPTSLVVALSGPTAFASASVPVPFSAGDTLGVYYESSVGVPHEVDATVEVTYATPGPDDVIVLSSGSNAVGNNQTVWVGQGELTNDSGGFQFFDRNLLMSSGGTVDTLGIHRNNLDVTGGDSTATLYLNGAPTSLVVALSGPTAFASASVPVAFSAGDTLGVYYESSVGVPHEVDATVEVTYVEPGPADAILLSTGSSSVGSGQKVWVGQGAHTSDSSGFQFFDRNALMASAGTVDKLAIHRNNLEASGGESTATLYLNGAPTSLVVALSGTTAFASASVPVGFSAGDTLGVYYESSVGVPHEVDATVEVSYAEVPGPGAVPDGSGDEAPLRASRDLIDPMLINLTWSRSCGTAIDFAVYEGTLGDPESLTAVTCSTGGEASFQLAVPAGDVFWVVVPITATEEGSYGEDSSGSERGPATSPCAGVFHPVSCPAAF